ncbi:hypothetical protein SUGI_0797140 [Cryptomeria japonica]|nr:hypothetical protein SUGI_0797140 [Cryptomeria japonica]
MRGVDAKAGARVSGETKGGDDEADEHDVFVAALLYLQSIWGVWWRGEKVWRCLWQPDGKIGSSLPAQCAGVLSPLARARELPFVELCYEEFKGPFTLDISASIFFSGGCLCPCSSFAALCQSSWGVWASLSRVAGVGVGFVAVVVDISAIDALSGSGEGCAGGRVSYGGDGASVVDVVGVGVLQTEEVGVALLRVDGGAFLDSARSGGVVLVASLVHVWGFCFPPFLFILSWCGGGFRDLGGASSVWFFSGFGVQRGVLGVLFFVKVRWFC